MLCAIAACSNEATVFLSDVAIDASTAPLDAGTTNGEDGPQVKADASSPDVDSEPSNDAGVTDFDAGASKIDAGLVKPDAGLSQPVDSGVLFKDYVMVGGNNTIGVYAIEATGKLTKTAEVTGIQNPNYLALSPSSKQVFALSATPTGAVTAFSVDWQTGTLTRGKTTATESDSPAHLAVDPRKGAVTNVAVASFGDGAVTSMQFDASTGALSTVESKVRGVKAHQVVFSDSSAFAYVPMLGSDAIAQFQVSAAGKLTPLNPASVATKPGAGPRHLALHPNGQWAYLINQTDMTMSLLSVGADGTLKTEQTLSTLADNVTKQANWNCSHVLVHPNGKWVFGGNRGQNAIVTLGVDSFNGTLTRIANTSTEGSTPRDFGIDQAGRFLYVGNQDSATVVGFRINADTGVLTSLSSVADFNRPNFVGVFRLRR